jgi:glycosyltransferase involved in cell wall biosynthesis
MSVSCVAILCVRNEQAHLDRSIGDLVAQGIDVAVIDHGSTDGSAAIFDRYLGQGLVRVERLPWLGSFDLTAQLQAKRELARQLDYDWVVHADADEWMHSRRTGESLLEGISRLDAEGFNAINCEEFVFLPSPEAADPPSDCKRDLLDYYFFAPAPIRLMRAWKRRDALDNARSGGHLLDGPDLRLAPEYFVLRHYIVLSHRQAVEKYADRVFSAGDLARGWHQNRLDLGVERLKLPEPARLRRLPRWDIRQLDRADPKTVHYWDWSPTASV